MNSQTIIWAASACWRWASACRRWARPCDRQSGPTVPQQFLSASGPEMPRLIGWLIIVHAVITGVVWTAPLLPDAPFNPSHSWLLGDSRTIAVPVSLLVAVALAATGVGLLLNQPWWAPLGLGSGAAAVAFILVYFNPWLSLAVAINAVIAIAAASSLAHA